MSVCAIAIADSPSSYYVLFIFLIFIVVVIVVVLFTAFLLLLVVAFDRVILVIVGCGSWSAWRRAGRRHVIFVDFGLRVEWLIVRTRITVVVAGHDVNDSGGKSGVL